jgi:glycosyltransferase involved in cell wall biosynthesis
MTAGSLSLMHAANAPVGANVVGYLDAPLGIGEVARNIAAALKSAGVAVSEVPVANDAAPSAKVPGPPSTLYPVNVVCINPDGLAGAEAQLGRSFFTDRYTIGYWWWEVEAFPPGWERSFDLVDEIWTGSRFVADVLAPAAPVPVLRMPVPLEAPAPSGAPIELRDGFKFLTVYDYRSIPARKNPLGAIEAFRRAGIADARLVLKCVGNDAYPADHEEVVARASEAGSVDVIDRVLPPGGVASLIAACDAYVSLHRAEGLGLPLGAALYAGKPVIATRYGGPVDFLTDENSYPVGYRMTAIGPGNEPYPADAQWAEPDLDEAAGHMRRIVERPDEARGRAAAGRSDAERLFALERAGAEMGARLARVTLGRSSPRDDGSAVAQLVRMIETDLEPAPGRRGEAVRGGLRRMLFRALQPYTAHRREVDAELIRTLRALEERISGLERSLAVLESTQSRQDR